MGINNHKKMFYKRKIYFFLRRKTYTEIKENEYLFQNENPSILDQRFESCLIWYIKNACFYKRVFYISMILSGICPTISVALNNLLFQNCIQFNIEWIVFLASITAGVSITVLNLSRAQDKWTRYRISAEFLKRQRTEYLVQKQLLNGDCSELDLKYLKIIEDFMFNENDQWRMENMNKNFTEKREKINHGREEEQENETSGEGL